MGSEFIEPGTCAPSNDQSGRSLVIVVPRTRLDLYESLISSFNADAKLQVILDRRFRNRRARDGSHEPERRRGDRRRLPIEADLQTARSVTVPVSASRLDFTDPDVRALLFLCCGEHVIGCHRCEMTYRLRWLPRTDSGGYTCPRCALDMTPAVVAHTETCSYWTPRGANSRPQLRPVASTRSRTLRVDDETRRGRK